MGAAVGASWGTVDHEGGSSARAGRGSSAFAQRVACRWIDALNRRDAEALAAQCAARVRFTPTIDHGRRTYVGRDEVRGWVARVSSCEVRRSSPRSHIEIRSARAIGPDSVLVGGHVCVDRTRVNPFVALLVVDADELVVSAHAFFSGEDAVDRLTA